MENITKRNGNVKVTIYNTNYKFSNYTLSNFDENTGSWLILHARAIEICQIINQKIKLSNIFTHPQRDDSFFNPKSAFFNQLTYIKC